MAKKVNKYETPNGITVPGTTTITGNISKPALYYWYGKHGNTKCAKIIKESQEFGSRIHMLIEAVSKGQKPTLSKDEKQVMDNYKVWEKDNVKEYLWFEKDFALDDHDFEFTEEGVKYKLPFYGYGGTADLCYIDKEGRRILGDIKTGGHWPEHNLQVAAYEYGLGKAYDEKFDGKVIIALDKKTKVWEGLKINTLGHMRHFVELRGTQRWKTGK